MRHRSSSAPRLRGVRAGALLLVSAVGVSVAVLTVRASADRDDTAAARPPAARPAAVAVAPRTSAAPAPVVRRPTAAELDTAVCRAADAHHKLIRVSISQQRAWLCNRSALFLATPVTTGADVKSHRTHTGTWKIRHEWPDAWLSGPGYNQHVDYWMPYDGQFGIHDASWQKFPFGSAKWRTDGSHGCVHVPHAAMKTLFTWAPIGTKITIVA